MKAKILSDLHMEGRGFYYEWHGEDILFLAGDIHTKNRHHELLEQIPQHVQVIFVPGNHEYYGKDIVYAKAYFRELEWQYNFHFLDNNAITIGNYEIFGGTMYTGFDCHGEQQKWFAKHAAKDMIADFHWTTFAEQRWTVQDHEDEHQFFKDKLDAWILATEGKKRIIMTHFMPMERCGDIKFAGSTLNPYFCADMGKYMGLADFWIAGHGHTPYDKEIDGTRVIINPKGYRNEDGNGFRDNLIINLD